MKTMHSYGKNTSFIILSLFYILLLGILACSSGNENVGAPNAASGEQVVTDSANNTYTEGLVDTTDANVEMNDTVTETSSLHKMNGDQQGELGGIGNASTRNTNFNGTTSTEGRGLQGTTDLPTRPIEETQDWKVVKGVLGLCYTKKISIGTYKNFIVYTNFSNEGKKIDVAQVREKLEEIRKESVAVNKRDDDKDACDTVFLPELFAYDSLVVSINADDSRFHLDDYEIPARQKLNFDDGNIWKWKVTPKGEDAFNSGITIRVQAITPEGVPQVVKTELIDVNVEAVEIKKSGWEKFMAQLKDINYLYTAILLPVVLFIRKFWLDKKKKKNVQK